MAMQMYKKRTCCATKIPAVTLGKSSLSFNSAARAQFLDIKKPYALLAYDPDTHEIGIKLIDQEVPDSLCFNFGKEDDRGCASLSASGFVKQFDIAERWKCDIKTRKDWLILTPKEGYVPKEISGKKKQIDPAPPAPTNPKLGPKKKKLEYECQECGHTNPQWKYQHLDGHPKKCQCGSTAFSVIED